MGAGSKQAAHRALSDFLERRLLRRAAGTRAYERGKRYADEGRVRAAAEDRGVLSARVVGTKAYRVTLREKDGSPAFSCTCPQGRDGKFCKHAVALGITWLERSEGAATSPLSGREITGGDLKRHLAGMKKKELEDLVMEQAERDAAVRSRLVGRVARAEPGGRGLVSLRRAVDDAVAVLGAAEDEESGEAMESLEEVARAAAGLLKAGRAADAFALAEYSLEEMDGAAGMVDRHDDVLPGLMEEFAGLHLKACRKARPDPTALARRLFKWEMHGESGQLPSAFPAYVRLLGKDGLAAFRRLAEAEWARVPAIRSEEASFDERRGRHEITRIMEELARHYGDFEAQVAVKAKDLSGPHSYLEIAETYRKAGKRDKAMEWAERGLKAFSREPDAGLSEFIADGHHRRGRHGEAMTLMWNAFAATPSEWTYRVLRRHAQRAGGWADCRRKAHAFLRGEGEVGPGSGRRFVRDDRSLLVEILLGEKDAEAAWREAKAGGCSRHWWLKLAQAREKDHPEDVVPIYQERAEQALRWTNKGAYREAVGLLKRLHDVMRRMDRLPEFSSYVASLRLAHGRKRNFLKLLDRTGWNALPRR